MLFKSPSTSLILLLQIFIIVIDIICNSISIVLIRNTTVLLVVCFFQDIGILFALVLTFIVFFNTAVFKAGLLGVLMKKFSGTLFVVTAYMVTTVSFHAWNLSVRWNHSSEYTWSNGLQALYVIQKMLAVFYYYLYKRFSFKLCDAKYYKTLEWTRRH